MDNSYSPEVEYTNDYYHFMSPAMIDCIALNAGYVLPDTHAGFNYCELGCGFGLTTNCLAATHPEGRFYGVDLSAEQIGAARAVASEIGLDNILFLAADLMALDVEGLPELDYVAMHGLYSWVPEPVRRQALRLIGAKLKPGGRVFVSHDVLPGWHAVMPIRDFLLAESRKCGSMPVLERTKHAMDRLRVMLEKRANFVASDPGVFDWANTLLKQDPRYVAHEYLVSCLEPQPFRKVAEDFLAIGLRYAGDSREVLNNFRLCVPSHLHAEIARESDAIERESLKDFLFATTFRRSVFVRSLSDGVRGGRDLGDQAWGLMEAAFDSPDANFPSGKCRLDHPIYLAIIEQLRPGPRPWSEVRQVLSHVPERTLFGALMTLFAAHRVSPFRMNPQVPRCAVYNAHLLESSERQSLLLSSSFGGAAPADDLERLYLYIRGQGMTTTGSIASGMHGEAIRRGWYRESPLLAGFGTADSARLAGHESAARQLMQQEDRFRSMGWLTDVRP